MKRVAIVVQRCHDSVVGGSEALAWQYARLLAGRFEVEILTTTATDCVSWANALAPGPERREDLLIRRFPTAFERGRYWYELHRRLMLEVQPHLAPPPCLWRAAQQEEYIRFQGPYCPALEDWLLAHRGDYAAVLFCTYLYAPSYFGIRLIGPRRAILIPTLHDEVPAWLPVYAARYAAFPHRIWLTEAERRTATRLWGLDGGAVLGMAVEQAQAAAPAALDAPYLLYCGRIDAAKGCDALLQAFERLPERGHAKLVFTGSDHLGLPKQPWIAYHGFVDAARKRALMAGAAGFVLPSRYESFSIVTLEAMAQGTPVLVNGQCEVMREHIEASAGGYCFTDGAQMTERMRRLLTLDPETRARMGAAGRAYVLERYGEDAVRTRLVDCVERVIADADRLEAGAP